MQRKKLACIAMAMLSQTAVFAGGLLTNTNQSFIFGRNFARDGVIAIDGVYSNPAGVAFWVRASISLSVVRAPHRRVPSVAA